MPPAYRPSGPAPPPRKEQRDRPPSCVPVPDLQRAFHAIQAERGDPQAISASALPFRSLQRSDLFSPLAIPENVPGKTAPLVPHLDPYAVALGTRGHLDDGASRRELDGVAHDVPQDRIAQDRHGRADRELGADGQHEILRLGCQPGGEHVVQLIVERTDGDQGPAGELAGLHAPRRPDDGMHALRHGVNAFQERCGVHCLSHCRRSAVQERRQRIAEVVEEDRVETRPFIDLAAKVMGLGVQALHQPSVLLPYAKCRQAGHDRGEDEVRHDQHVGEGKRPRRDSGKGIERQYPEQGDDDHPAVAQERSIDDQEGEQHMERGDRAGRCTIDAVKGVQKKRDQHQPGQGPQPVRATVDQDEDHGTEQRVGQVGPGRRPADQEVAEDQQREHGGRDREHKAEGPDAVVVKPRNGIGRLSEPGCPPSDPAGRSFVRVMSIRQRVPSSPVLCIVVPRKKRV